MFLRSEIHSIIYPVTLKNRLTLFRYINLNLFGGNTLEFYSVPTSQNMSHPLEKFAIVQNRHILSSAKLYFIVKQKLFNCSLFPKIHNITCSVVLNL